jgi:hypothetical protein
MTNFFKISELSKNTLVGRDIGKETRLKIKDLLSEHETIIIDMENSKQFSPSFIDEAIVKLVIELGKEEFKRSLKLINISEGMKSLMNSILHRNLNRDT